MKLIKPPIYPYTTAQLRADHPNVSFPSPLNAADLIDFGVFEVFPTERPAYNPMTHTVVEVAPVSENGLWIQQWAVVALTPEQQGQALAALKKT